MPTTVPMERITSKIYLVRGQKVMLDRDLAELYGVETRTLVQAVKRNKQRIPHDFMFQLTKDEFDALRSQIVISKTRGDRRYPFQPFNYLTRKPINDNYCLSLSDKTVWYKKSG